MRNTWLTLMKVKHCLVFLFLIISFQMVEALLEEAQEDIIGSEVILVDEAGETPGTPWSFNRELKHEDFSRRRRGEIREGLVLTSSFSRQILIC